MRQRVEYDVVRRPTNTTTGRTNIVYKHIQDDKVVKTLDIGYIEKLRGSETVTAYVKVDENDYRVINDDNLKTRSKAAHRILREYKAIHNVKVS